MGENPVLTDSPFMKKNRTNVIGFALVLLLSLMLPPMAAARSSFHAYDLAKIRKARDLIEAREYEAAYKILESYDGYHGHYDRDIELKARHRMADLRMRKDKANPYYHLVYGCTLMRSAAEAVNDHTAHVHWAYAQMLKKSPYLKMMPRLLSAELYKWNLSAAEKGFAPSQEELGMVLSAGTGPQTDYTQAYMWLKLACDRYAGAPARDGARAGRRMALVKAHVAMLERKYLSPQQVKKAVKMARKWEKKHAHAWKIWPVADQDY